MATSPSPLCCRHCGVRRHQPHALCAPLLARLGPEHQAALAPLRPALTRPLAGGLLVGVEVLRTADDLDTGEHTGRAQHLVSVWVGTAELIDDLWIYPTMAAALLAARTWDGTTPEPSGWEHHPTSGRRRPDGDPQREYVWH